MENKKGSGIFLGVVSVATLIVAIIGATFAFFSANAGSENNAVNLTAYEFNVDLDVTSKVLTKGAFIPLDPATAVEHATHKTNMAYAMNVGTDENICIADGGFQVCELYEITFTNTGETVELTANLVTTSNEASATGTGRTPFENLKAQLVTEDGGVYSLDADNPAVKVAETAEGSVALTAEGQTISVANGETKLYLVVWLDEAKDAESGDPIDQSNEMGAKFVGQLLFNSNAGGTLTGTFTVSAVTPTPEDLEQQG